MWAKIHEYWEALKDFFYSLVLSIQAMLKDLFLWIFEQILTLVLHALNGLGSLFTALDFTQYISAIPDGTRNVMALCGIDIITSMIVSAIIIRLMLQLIPFVRLGS